MNTLFTYIALYLLAFSAFASEVSSEDTAYSKSTPVTKVKSINITMISSTVVRGEIESPSTPRIAAKVSAEVVSINVDEGMRVKAGQLLAELDNEAFKIAEESAKANIQRMVVLIENQKKILSRNQELIDKKMISQSAVDNAITALKQSQAELNSAKANLKKSQYQLSHTRIISPLEGVIQHRAVSKGGYVKSGDLLFQIVSADHLRARIYFPDTLVASIHTGMQVQLKKGNETLEGKINSMRPMLEEGTRALHALVNFENVSHWQAGSSIAATVILDEHLNAVAVPERALVRRPAGMVLYQINGDAVTEKVVTIGLKQGKLIEVTSGLDADKWIVLDGAAWLTDGAKINIQESE